MKINLFELIEGFFHGVVYFIYNMFHSIWWTLRHPVKGPLHLYRRYRKEGVEQVGGLTFLFALLFSFFFVMLKLFEGENVPDFLSDVMRSGEMGGLTIWQSFAFSVVSTVIVDALIRLYIMLAGPRRIERGKMVLAATEYALIWPLLVLPLAVYAGVNIINEDMTDDQLWNRSMQFAVGFLILFSIASFPAACLITAGLKRAKRLHYIFCIPGKRKIKPDGMPN